MTEAQAIALFKCLADKSRLQILKNLAVEDMFVERLAQRLELTPPTVSFHLKKRSEAGAVSSYKKIENSFVSGYKKIEDKFVQKFLARKGETTEETKKRLSRK